jgi:hypothetical protein
MRTEDRGVTPRILRNARTPRLRPGGPVSLRVFQTFVTNTNVLQSGATVTVGGAVGTFAGSTGGCIAP